jgi:hypothetical protein
VLAVDEEGNVVSLIHSLNGMLCGDLCRRISIPDSVSFQQQMIAENGPGERLPDASSLLIVLKGAKAVLTSTTNRRWHGEIRAAERDQLSNFGMDPKTSVDQPKTRGPFYGGAGNPDRGKRSRGSRRIVSKSEPSTTKQANGLGFRSIHRPTSSPEGSHVFWQRSLKATEKL